MPVIETIRTATSAAQSSRSAAMMPSGTPRPVLRTTAKTASSMSHPGSLPRRASSTGWAAVRELQVASSRRLET